MIIRNKRTGQKHEVLEGTLFPDFFERVDDDEIKVGEPKVDIEIEKAKDEPAEVVAKTSTTKEKKSPVLTKKSKSVKTGKKAARKTVKGAKKDE